MILLDTNTVDSLSSKNFEVLRTHQPIVPLGSIVSQRARQSILCYYSGLTRGVDGISESRIDPTPGGATLPAARDAVHRFAANV